MTLSTHERAGTGLWLGEVVATLGLVLVIFGVARTLSDTFAGIAPGSVTAFVAAQLAGGVLAYALVRVLYPDAAAVAALATAPPLDVAKEPS